MGRAKSRRGRGTSKKGRGSRESVEQSIMDVALETAASVEQTGEEREKADSNMAVAETVVQEVNETTKMGVQNENSEKETTGEEVRRLEEEAEEGRTSKKEAENVEEDSSNTEGDVREEKEFENEETQKEGNAQIEEENEVQSVSEEIRRNLKLGQIKENFDYNRLPQYRGDLSESHNLL